LLKSVHVDCTGLDSDECEGECNDGNDYPCEHCGDAKGEEDEVERCNECNSKSDEAADEKLHDVLPKFVRLA